jgi:hypothetical protein
LPTKTSDAPPTLLPWSRDPGRQIGSWDGLDKSLGHVKNTSKPKTRFVKRKG